MVCMFNNCLYLLLFLSFPPNMCNLILHWCINEVQTPVVLQLFTPNILFHHLTTPANCILFLFSRSPLQNMSCSTIQTSFSVVFCSFRVPAPRPTHTNPFIPVSTHPRHFSPAIAQHDVRGNFPGHRVGKHVLITYFRLCLPCSAARLCPCTP